MSRHPEPPGAEPSASVRPARVRPARVRPRPLRRAGLSAAAATALAWSAVLAAPGLVLGWEEPLFAAVNGLPALLLPLLWVPMQAGSLAGAVTCAGAALAARRRRLALELAVGGAAAWLIAKVAKALITRPRPAALLADVALRGGDLGGLGYPSGHVTVAAALATIAAPHLPRRLGLALWVLVAVVAVARMYVGVHLPLDIIGGVALGFGVGVLLRGVADRLTAPRPPTG